MPIHNKYFTGSSVSRHLSADERSFSEVIYQSGKPVLDSELNLNQEVRQRVRQLLSDRGVPSGFLRGQGRTDPMDAFFFPSAGSASWVADSFLMLKQTVLVGGFPLVLEYINTPTSGQNRIQLDAATTYNGTPPTIKRTDFVFLEVWQALVSNSANATGTVTVLPLGAPAPTTIVDGDVLTMGGVPLTARAAAPVVDEFLIGADQATTASAIAAAINNPVNSFSGFLTASATSAVVTLRSNVSGTAGNGITLAITGVGMATSAPTLLGGVDEPNKPTQDTIYRHGNVDADATVNLADDLADPVVGTETAKRVQVQYRIRVTGQTEAVSFKSEPDGFSNVSVLAQGGQAAPVATYRFVPADNSSTAGSSDATAYGYVDTGLWVAGDGSSAAAAALGTVDGFVYAIPISFVFRRNDAFNGGAGAGWDPLNNTNGGLPYPHALFVNPSVGSIAANLSDRPDGAFHNSLQDTDLQDLRFHIAEAGVDLVAELQYQVQSLLDGKCRTWAIDASDKNTLGGGSGDVATQYLVCNQIGRDAGHGGTSPISGSTLRGDTIRNYDHCSRRFGDQPVNEILVLAIYPTDAVGAQPGKYVTRPGYAVAYAGWAEDDEINLDLDTLNASTPGDYDNAKATFFGFGPGNASILDFAPPGTMIVDVRSVRHDDGHYTTAVDQNAAIKLLTGLGTGHIKITLDRNDDVVNGGHPGNPDYRMVGDTVLDNGSSRRLFIELEVAYPLGAGTTDTPDVEVVPDPTVWVRGPILENNTAMRPDDWDDLIKPRFRSGYRETVSEYIATDPNAVGPGSGTPLTDTIVSASRTNMRFPRRVFGSAARVVGVTDVPNAQPHNIDENASDYGSSSRLMTLITGGGTPPDQALAGLGQTLCGISYFAQDPIPNWGALGGGYQVGVYYRSTAPQTLGSRGGALSTLPDPLAVKPLVTMGQVYSGQVGMGSVDLSFPYASPLEQIPVNDDGTGSFPKEWYFAATASISVADFNATTGLLKLHSFVQVDGTDKLTLTGKDTDNEMRAMFKGVDTTVYRPVAMAQDLSNVTRHKNWTAMLVQAVVDSDLFRKDEVLLLVISRFAELDDKNIVGVTDTNNRTCTAIYRLRNRLAIVGD